ncbi:MAG: hypothetical protein HYX34_13095 [Actinobacteria bacterium]|nr:hypothetical protein [Actinomycetota bacterium]
MSLLRPAMLDNEPSQLVDRSQGIRPLARIELWLVNAEAGVEVVAA